MGKENTSAIPGMQVKGNNGDSNRLRLLRLYVRKDLPVDKEEIATPEKITEWEYFKPVAKMMCAHGLLIGACCMKVLQPIQVRPCESGGPVPAELDWDGA